MLGWVVVLGGTYAWDGVRGQHGVGQVNENGEALLSWCAQNGLAVMNTMFQKKRIHQYTWQHPGSKQWHCIDYVQSQRSQCCDVRVLRSADCWTDHKLLRGQLKITTTLQHFWQHAIFSTSLSTLQSAHSN